MVFTRFPWQTATPSDPDFAAYVSSGLQSKFLDRLPAHKAATMRRMLDPDANTRCSIEEVLDEPWVARHRPRLGPGSRDTAPGVKKQERIDSRMGAVPMSRLWKLVFVAIPL
ncbi:hypothetical protein BDK51DRAFT_47909 [Blyttiomyces helicus]|uniref:Protein kinase domain-containing protein n=1 Tax=Blyttiomyces helicus TaxID=388810 RepID=A0A4P9W4D0_9FUNG|nr:hypothetical protein BDK51DRAFT_47909 [Blyttiomyces helicus]|eukprot:RKO85540.1 hypothetical protein BDK51DRAFT_47909 [Blyttiomyces helicus]